MVNPPVSWNLVFCTTISVLLLLLNNEMTSSADKISPVGVKMCCLICKRHGNCKSTSYDEESLVCDTDSKQRKGESFEDLCDNNEIPDACWRNQCGQKQHCLTTPRNEARCVHKEDHNRRSYNTIINQWSRKLPNVTFNNHVSIAVVKGLIIVAVDGRQFDIAAYLISNTTVHAGFRIKLNQRSKPTIDKFGDKIIARYKGLTTIMAFSVDFKSITFDFNITTNNMYGLISVVNNTTIVGLIQGNSWKRHVFDVLTINGSIVKCRRLDVSGSLLPEWSFTRFSVTYDFNIIGVDLPNRTICLDKQGNMKWNIINFTFADVTDMRTDDHANVFILDGVKKRLYLKQNGDYFKLIIDDLPISLPLDQHLSLISVVQYGTVHLFSKDANGDMYVHVYVFN